MYNNDVLTKGHSVALLRIGFQKVFGRLESRLMKLCLKGFRFGARHWPFIKIVGYRLKEGAKNIRHNPLRASCLLGGAGKLS